MVWKKSPKQTWRKDIELEVSELRGRLRTRGGKKLIRNLLGQTEADKKLLEAHLRSLELSESETSQTIKQNPNTQDFFISHAGADKAQFIQPLVEALTYRRVTFWLDSNEIEWGGPLAIRINDGLRRSRYVLVCLSGAFVSSEWAKAELNAAIVAMVQQSSNRILPLILYEKEKVLLEFPLIGGLIYREYSGPEAVADELAAIVSSQQGPSGKEPSKELDRVQITIESLHSGSLSRVEVSRNCSFEWLVCHALQAVGAKDTLQAGTFDEVKLQWTLVQSNLEDEWNKLKGHGRRDVWAIIQNQIGGVVTVYDRHQLLSDFDVNYEVTFHLRATIREPDPFLDIAAMNRRVGSGEHQIPHHHYEVPFPETFPLRPGIRDEDCPDIPAFLRRQAD